MVWSPAGSADVNETGGLIFNGLGQCQDDGPGAFTVEIIDDDIDAFCE